MKRLLRVIELSKNEQRVVLLVTLILITIAFVGYERRIRRLSVEHTSAAEAKPSPSVMKRVDDQ